MIFVDSNLWLYLYLLDQDPNKRRLLIEKMIDGGPWVITSQVLVEVGANLCRKGRMPEAQIRTALTDISDACLIHHLDQAVLLRASRIRESDTVSYWDSLIIAAALESRCVELWSEDMQAGRIFDGKLTLRNPLF